MKPTAALMATLLAAAAHAHEGHGMVGSHWHASDSLGTIVLAAMVVALVWAARRK